MLRSQKFIPGLLAGSILLTNPSVSLGGTFKEAGNSNFSKTTTSFVMPSGNIYCALIGEKEDVLRCEISSRLNPLPPQPYRGYCEFDWGAGFLLSQSGKPEILCISDTIGGSNYTLQYGSVWSNAGFKCMSQRTGLTCTNSTGRGFFLNRERWNVFGIKSIK
jgi:hypothetical protein